MHSPKVALQVDPNQSVGLGGDEAPGNSGQCGLILHLFCLSLNNPHIQVWQVPFDGSCSYVTLSILLSWPWPHTWEGSGERESGGHLCVWKLQVCILFKWFKRGGVGRIYWWNRRPRTVERAEDCPDLRSWSIWDETVYLSHRVPLCLFIPFSPRQAMWGKTWLGQGPLEEWSPEKPSFRVTVSKIPWHGWSQSKMCPSLLILNPGPAGTQDQHASVQNI